MQSPSSVKGPWEREWARVRLLSFSLLETTEYKQVQPKASKHQSCVGTVSCSEFLIKHEKTEEKRTMISPKATLVPRPFMFIVMSKRYNL